jgi:two-component system, chemotaxis family, chemotaxis protein CheY
MATAIIVDDSNLIRMRIKALLTQMGYDVLAEASNGREAIKKYIIYKPDLVTMDINMPEMNGLEALHAIKKNNPNAVVVIISTEGQEKIIHQAIGLGAQYFIVKPIKTNQFVNVIRSVMDNSEDIISSMNEMEIDNDITGVILTIDDSRTILHKLNDLLKEDGHTVIQADTGKLGIDFAMSGSPDLIVLDLNMPDMDGFAVLEQLRKSEVTRRIPVIILSAMTKREDVLNAMKYGVVDYVSKNLDDNDFLHKVKVALHNFRVTRNVRGEDEDQPVVIKKEENRATISFRQKLSDYETGKEVQKIFTRSYISLLAGNLVIFDLRMIQELEKSDIGFIAEVMFMLKESSIAIVAGKHYGFLVSEANLEESIELFISHGDLEEFYKETEFAQKTEVEIEE